MVGYKRHRVCSQILFHKIFCVVFYYFIPWNDCLFWGISNTKTPKKNWGFRRKKWYFYDGKIFFFPQWYAPIFDLKSSYVFWTKFPIIFYILVGGIMARWPRKYSYFVTNGRIQEIPCVFSNSISKSVLCGLLLFYPLEWLSFLGDIKYQNPHEKLGLS